ncbi:uncharacterized protein MEPE_01907 [Melanopsichium pennsylvanicum]|uniref:Uncharacterized protein n=2 Tax=Melanopsichium pennsylvanicum TaxID=63383 RepID=A0AAJ4XJZ2_9BASI|nr:putative protein [Melanopsichium pennsylvanicum 4]SNX83201.1 uncharacterized protein MEPE_01907 [Melanopsichium pennsylvanicum]
MSSLQIDDTQAASPRDSKGSLEASTSYKTQLPDKKTFIATLSGTAFVVGLTSATIYGLRKAKLQALKEAQELAEASASHVQSGLSSASGATITLQARASVPGSLLIAHPAAKVQRIDRMVRKEDQESDTSESTNAYALFRQMNAANLNPSKRSKLNPESPTSKAPISVFDDATGDLPSVLRRRRSGTASSTSPSSKSSFTADSAPILAASNLTFNPSNTSTSSSATATFPNSSDTKIDYSEMDSTLDFLGLSSPIPHEEQERMKALDEQAARQEVPRGFFQSPVGLSLKAFFIATSIVTFTTLTAMEVTKRLLGVETMDEFVVAMTKIIPSRQKGQASLQGAAPHLRVSRDAENLQRSSGTTLNASAPKSVDEALTDLSNASSFEEWVTTLKFQLDTERDYEVQRRFAGIDASNDAIAAPSRSYGVHSPLELEDLERNTLESASLSRSLLAISPVLPSTAFGLGLVSGMMTSGKRAGLVFMAENAHRLPDTVQGWYFYSKTKNYKVLLGAAKGGLRQGVRLGIWTTGFCLVERFAELTRSSILRQFKPDEKYGLRLLGHWTDGALAGVGTAAAATALYRLPKPSAVRVFQLGLLAGASTGGIRDLQERLVHKEIGGVASHT